MEEKTLIKPFLKWAGGKSRIVDLLKKHFPKDGKRFIEPFLGAGSVALNVDYPIYLVNDMNSDLISVWTELKENGMIFVNTCKTLFEAINNTKKHYYEFRKEFNTTEDKSRKAALFVYLNRHCFNGLCRYNSDGGYNVPKGEYKNPVYFPKDEFEKCLEKVKTFDIHNKDFKDIFKTVKANDVVYCDPPYAPLSTSSNFDTYSAGGFSFLNQYELARCAQEAMDKGATVVVSNHHNWYMEGLYQMHGAQIKTIDVSRVINSKADERNRVKEIIAIFQKKEKDETQD